MMLDRTNVVHDVEDKQSEFAGRSVLVTNKLTFTDRATGGLVSDQLKWFVHAERRQVSSPKAGDEAERSPKRRDEAASYTDEQLAEIEALYDAEYCRGADIAWYEDLVVGAELPTMVKGPITITDLINMHMGGGWFGYGNPALRLGFENRKRMRGFYTKNEFGAWDVVQRVHWETELARRVGVPATYDIGPMRWAWLIHYCTNWMGDDAWLFRVRGEFRKFNYMGDATWITGRITGKRVDAALGPAVELDITGTNQRGQQNLNGTATVLLASQKYGEVRLPPLPASATDS